MNTVICEEFTKEKALKDIEYCLENSNLKVRYSSDGEMFINNPHFYLNSSDNVKLATINIKENSSVLTVGSSGDYMLDAIYHGAKEVVNYDINEIQYYVICLKVWALQVLTYEEFVGFFTKSTSSSFMSSTILEKVISNFKNDNAYDFWNLYLQQLKKEDEIYFFMAGFVNAELKLQDLFELRYSFIGKEMPKTYPNVFRALRLINIENADIDSVGYLETKENYIKTQKNISGVKINFITSDINQLKKKLSIDKKFDIIFTSNISFYQDSNTYYDTVVNQLLPLLKDDGIINCYYQGMRVEWFNNKIEDDNYEVPNSEFIQTSALIMFGKKGVHNCIKGNKIISKEENLGIMYTQIPTYGGSSTTNVPYDVITNIRKKGKK